eukprot:366512-Chlamydomonas_euryale.AAC.8
MGMAATHNFSNTQKGTAATATDAATAAESQQQNGSSGMAGALASFLSGWRVACLHMGTCNV